MKLEHPFGGIVGDVVRAGGKLVELPRNIKQMLLLSLDMVFVNAAIWGAIALRLGTLDVHFGADELLCAAATTVFSAMIFLRQGLYRAVIRFMGQQAVWAIVRGVSYSTAVLVAAVFLTRTEVPRSLPFLYWLFAFVAIGGSRLLVRTYYQDKLHPACEKIIIYGAGESGRQLLAAAKSGGRYRAVCFIDDDPALHHSEIHGMRVLPPSKIGKLLRKREVSQIFLAMPSASPEQRRRIIKSLIDLPVYVRTVPRITDILERGMSVDQLQEIELEDLLEREPVPAHPELLDKRIRGKVVLVTGAGGSIGAELCRQILPAQPRELILLDSSEYALFSIERELRATQEKTGGGTAIAALLGSVRDQQTLAGIYRAYAVQTIYHAAAYKHVPLVEFNVAQGVLNNVFGTWRAAEAAIAAGVETFVLVSTDKAVRPANIMGASKRLAEMLCQGLAGEQEGTCFCMVRFGNVLGSSGSVVPLFREQIRSGGPLSVTHPEVTRYFMTLSEAAELVLQASAMASGGEVFVLNMGKPARILDIARRMVQLSGRSLRDDENPQGDIAIDFIGLRPGEKLHEELALGDQVVGTGHPMIMRTEDEFPPMAELRDTLRELEKCCDAADVGGIKAALGAAVSGFHGHTELHDHLWKRRQAEGGAVQGGATVQRLFPEGRRDR